jgi:1,4-alpha-glucan branching enzyme
MLTDFDAHLHAEGTHYRAYLKMGAHPCVMDGREGVHFAVWAPNAERVSVVGDFNRWNGQRHPMRPGPGSGIWRLFVPEAREGSLYKYDVVGRRGYQMLKADPYAFASELRPRSASRVFDLNRYTWGDAEWMARRRTADWLHRPLSIYEVHAGSWRRVHAEGKRWLTYRELADALIPYVLDLGFTHIELLPIAEHPYDGSWGYQTTGYYAPTARYGTPDDFRYFVDRCHQAGLGVILDWTPAHFPKDAHGLAFFDGTHLYEHADPRQGEHRDWGTLIFNYGRNEVRTFLLSNAVFWAEQYHADGLRVDAVASMIYLDYSRPPGEWIPNEYGGRENLAAISLLRRCNEILHGEFPGILTVAEESTAWPMVSRPTYVGGLGFSMKWNMGWMHDTLQYIARDPIYRKYHHGDLTFSLIYAFHENFILPFSHDEVVHGKRSLLGKMPGDRWQQFANLRLLYAYLHGHPGKKLLFMGAELAAPEEWNCHDELPWGLLDQEEHRGIQRLVRDLNALHRNEPALHERDFESEGFQWLELHDADNSVLVFLRRGLRREDVMICAYNFTPVPRLTYRIGAPFPGRYREVLNTDSAYYGGGNVGNGGAAIAEPLPWGPEPHSIVCTLPPLGAVFLRPDSRA